MLRPGLWPRQQCRPTESRAEERVYEALSTQLPEGWYAWHSLRIHDGLGIDGEGDFVVADPERGLLVVEVKGGRVEVRDGRWFQNSVPMKAAPREQGLGYVRRLVRQLRDRGCALPAYGVATCFPDTAFEHEPDQGDVAGRVLGEQDLSWLREALPAVMDRALPPARGGRGAWIAALHELWGETWTPRLRLGQKARKDEVDRVELDAQQLRVLDMLNGNERLLVHGGAGTGKTLLACEVAKRWAREGRSVLLLCFTEPLGMWLRASLEVPNVQVWTVRNFARDLLLQAGVGDSEPLGSEGWENLPWKAASDIVPHIEIPWDGIAIDEGQDFSLGDWALVEALAGKGRLWAFHDLKQAFWPDRSIVEDLFQARFNLILNYRCPPELFAVAEAYAGRELEVTALRSAVEKGQLAVVPCPSETSVPDKVAVELDKLRGEGLQAADIAVVSLRGQTAHDAVIRKERLGRHATVRASDSSLENNIVADTFLRFKGLERPAIVVTDLRLVQDRRDLRMHIALTRANLTARVIAPREVLLEDRVLSKLL